MGNEKKHQEVEISVEDVENGIRRMVNWMAPDSGQDGARGFWFKKFKSLHRFISDSWEVLEW